jgi:hypothetical protein
MRLSALLFCVVLAVAVGVGCGSGGSSDGTGPSGGETSSEATTAGVETNGSEGGDGGVETEGGSKSGPLSKKAFVKEAEAICRKIPTVYQERSEALAKSMKKGQKPTPAELKLKAAVPTDDLAVEELESLMPPAGDKQRVEAIIQSLESAVKGFEDEPESEFTGPKSPFAEWQKLTKEYGLSYCSQL